MNWLFAKKRRAQERVLQAVGAHQGTEDEIFERKYEEFKAYAADVQRCHDAFLLAIDSIDIFSNSCLCVGDSFKQLHINPNVTGNHSSSMNNPVLNKAQSSAIKMGTITDLNYNIGYDINEHLHQNIRTLLIEKCVKPTAYILNQLPAIDAKVAERKRILLDYDYFKAKLHRQHESLANSNANVMSDNYAKIAEKLNEKMQELAQVQIDVEIAMEEFDAARTTMLAPEIAVYNACMYYYSTSTAMLFSQLFTFMPQSAQELDHLVAITGISTLNPTLLNNDEMNMNSTIYSDLASSPLNTTLGCSATQNECQNPRKSMLSPMQHSYCKIQSLVHNMLLDVKSQDAMQTDIKSMVNPAPDPEFEIEGELAKIAGIDKEESSNVEEKGSEIEVDDSKPGMKGQEDLKAKVHMENDTANGEAEASMYQLKHLLEKYRMDPILARPPICGGSVGGYEQLPSLFEEKRLKFRNSLHRGRVVNTTQSFATSLAGVSGHVADDDALPDPPPHPIVECTSSTSFGLPMASVQVATSPALSVADAVVNSVEAGPASCAPPNKKYAAPKPAVVIVHEPPPTTPAHSSSTSSLVENAVVAATEVDTDTAASHASALESLAVALYDYDGVEASDLSFKVSCIHKSLWYLDLHMW